MVLVMDKDFDMEKEKVRVSNEGINGDDLNLNDEIRVSNEGINGVGLNLNDEIRVLNESINGDDLNLNDEIRVSYGNDFGGPKSEIDEIKVLPGKDKVLGDYHANGVTQEIEGCRVSSSRGGDDGDIVVNGGKSEIRNIALGVNEMENLEKLRTSGIDDSSVVEKSENDVGKTVVSGSGRKENSNLSSMVDFGIEDESETRQKGLVKGDRGLKFEWRGDLGAQVSKNSKKIFGIDIHGRVMRSLKAKVLGTEFEMGDMVWGKVKSHPWWPGHLFNEAFASSSVRRTRRDGHILVAFFGDSSYGWFEPDELVLYDPHYAEKSVQTNSKNFVWAVEDSVDEASRRSALGLSCYCRNPSNFQPTNVPGYLSVDIVDFEPGTVYSISQIQKARDSFRPKETLSFILKLAVAPMSDDSSKSLDFVKNKATALAYRRSRFEEFDGTYAEAFGHKPERPQLPQASSRAALTGPLVFADTFDGHKNSTKAMKPKDPSKKDKYLFKRRDESVDLRTAKKSHSHASPSSSVRDDRTFDSTMGGYVFQKRDHNASNNDLAESLAVNQLATSGYAVTSKDIPIPNAGRNLSSVLQRSDSDEPGTADSGEVRRVPDKHLAILTSSDAGNLAGSGNLLKKNKTIKRPASALSFEKAEPQKKKLKKTENSRISEHHKSYSSLSDRNSPAIPGETPIFESEQLKDIESTNYFPQKAGLTLSEGDWEKQGDVRQILTDLHGLALNPFHGIERNGPFIALHFLLKFRSLVFLKSGSASAIVESEHAEVVDRPTTKSSKTVLSLKSPRLSVGPHDSTKKDGKRKPSERQEENAAKRVKKVTDVKSLTVERRALLKKPELQGSDEKTKVSASKGLLSKPVKKPERPVRVEEPTYLVMKYPSDSSLPSVMELKAKFARFGPMDTSLSRVFYKTNTCRVAFLFKEDANVAYRYAVGSKTVFSNVRFMLKPVAGPESQQPSSGKSEGLHGGPVSNPDPSPAELRPAIQSVLPHSGQQLKSILKKPESSGANNGGGGCLRTPRVRFYIGEEKSTANNNSGLQVKLIESRSPVTSSNEDAPQSSSCVAMDVNNNQRLISSHPLEPPLLPLPQFVRPPTNHQFRHSEMVLRKMFHENITPTPTPTTADLPGVSQVLPPPPPQAADISEQMMSLLTSCHDVVTNVKNTLGYMPYHLL